MVALIKFVISNKLPMSLVEDPSFQSLLNIAQSAQSDDIVKLPKKDSFKNKVHASRFYATPTAQPEANANSIFELTNLFLTPSYLL